jgi:hypothetical protein
MGPLLVILVSSCAFAATAGVGRGRWARPGPVERHQQALDILADIAQSAEVSRAEAREGLNVPPAGHQAHVRLIGPAGPIEATEAPLPPPRPLARSSSGRAGRPAAVRWLAAAAVVVALAAATATLHLAHTPAPSQGRRNAPSSVRGAVTSTARAAPTTVPTTVPTSRAPAVPTTAAPPVSPAPAVLVGRVGGTATYQLKSPSASIVVQARGPCWTEIRMGSSKGRVFYRGTLKAGMASKVTGPAWVRLGDPVYASVTVDGAHMPIPGATKAVPLNLVFTLS